MSALKELAKKILRKLNLFDWAYRHYMEVKNHWVSGSPKKQEEIFYKSFENFISQMVNMRECHSQKTLLFYGYMLTTRKRLIYKACQALIDKYPRNRVLLFTNPSASNGRKKAAVLLAKIVPTEIIELPDSVGSQTQSTILKLRLTNEIAELIAEKPYLQNAIKNAKKSYCSAAPNYVEVLMYEYYRCYQSVLDNVNISTVVIWNAFKFNHYLFAEICKERGVPIAYAEFGSLPGTLVFDTVGQMGESDPAVKFEEFKKLPITQENCSHAEQIIEALRMSGLNRNKQPEHQEDDELTGRLKPGRPIILFAGQCDRDSGMIPYTEITQKYHSPSFESSIECMMFVAELAKQHDWNLIFKPHPLVKHEVDEISLPDNVLLVKDININDIIDIADVVVTILSSLVYVSLIRNTATVMLGYNQIHGKGCAYEALTRESIESVISEAIENGYTAEQQKAFIQHVAQMEKYYLYSDGEPKGEIEYGQPFDKAVQFFEQLIAPSDSSNDIFYDDQEPPQSLFVCSSLTSLLSAIHVRMRMPENSRVDLLVNRLPLLQKANLAELFAPLFDHVVFTDISSHNPKFETDEDKISWRQNNQAAIQAALYSKNYLHFYFSCLEISNQLVFDALSDPATRNWIHLFEAEKNNFVSFHSISKSIGRYANLFGKEQINRFLNSMNEVMLYNLATAERGTFKQGVTTLTPLSGFVSTDEKNLITALAKQVSCQALVLLQDTVPLNFSCKQVLEIAVIIDQFIETELVSENAYENIEKE